jgi:apolipoprotein D and lipocalin family protein
MFKSIVFATLALVGLVNAGITTGSCPTPALQPNFDATKYVGLWWEQARDAGMPWESNDCQQARYSINPDGTVKVHNTQYNPQKDVVEEAFATATFDGAHGKVKFFEYAPAGDYRVLATDYENYALVYSCDTYLVAKTEYIWVLTREEKPSEAFIYNALQTLKQKVPDYDQTQIRRTMQGSLYKCKYISDAPKTENQ